MKKMILIDAKTTKKTEINVPAGWNGDINLPLVAQAARVYEDRQHKGLARVKGRGEISASTRKIYKQKGTGGARHGAISAPIFVGGGIAHGPKGVKRVLRLSKKMNTRALESTYRLKVSEGAVVYVDGFDSITKTKSAQALINAAMDGKSGKRVLVLVNEMTEVLVKAFRNISDVTVVPQKNVSVRDLIVSSLILVESSTDSKQVSKDKPTKTVKPVSKKSEKAKK
jgi:large subunit ribosomal protein L4